MPRVTLQELTDLTTRALAQAGATPGAAAATARALVAADARGLASHGVSRAPLYIAHLRNGRVLGQANPEMIHSRGGAALIDAHDGLAYPACDMAVDEGIRRARDSGVSFIGITNSNHPGAMGLHLEPVAAQGMVGLMFTNSPYAMPAWGGRTPLFGTNPIAAVFPRRKASPLVIDLSLSEVARGKLLVAAREGRSIPEGWAFDPDGQPTTDPQKGLAGSMAPMGGVKGAMLALMVELLCVALTGAHFAFEAESFFNETGNQARLGQALMVIDPNALAGSEVFYNRVDALVALMLQNPGVRLPGERRERLLADAVANGIEIADALYQQLQGLAA